MRNAGRIVGNSTDQTASILMCNGLASFCRKSHALRDVAKGMLVKKEFRTIPVKVFQYLYPFRPVFNFFYQSTFFIDKQQEVSINPGKRFGMPHFWIPAFAGMTGT